MALGTDVEHADEALALAAVVRTRLAEDEHACRRSPPPSPPAMVGRFVDAATDDRRNPAAAMSYLFDDTTFGTDFLVATTRTLVERELDEAGDEPEHGAAAVAGTMGRCRLDPQPRARRRDDGNGRSELLRGDDPMYALLETHRPRRRRRPGRVHRRPVAALPLRAARRCSSTGCAAWRPPPRRAAAGPDVVVGADPGTARRRRPRGVGVRQPRRPARPRPAVGVLRQRRRQPVGRDDPRPAPVRRAQRRARRPGRGSTTRTRPMLVEIDDADPWRRHHRRRARCSTRRPSTSSPTWPSTRPTAWRRSGPPSTSTSRPRRRSASAGSPTATDRRTSTASSREAIADAARLEAYFIAHAGHRAEANGRSVGRRDRRCGSTSPRSRSARATGSSSATAARPGDSRRRSSASSSDRPPTSPAPVRHPRGRGGAAGDRGQRRGRHRPAHLRLVPRARTARVSSRPICPIGCAGRWRARRVGGVPPARRGTSARSSATTSRRPPEPAA